MAKASHLATLSGALVSSASASMLVNSNDNVTEAGIRYVDTVAFLAYNQCRDRAAYFLGRLCRGGLAWMMPSQPRLVELSYHKRWN
jgi:hypothetical protein